jgi:uncharacterized Zn finger protein
MVSAKDIDNFIRNFERDQISNWTIHALERAGRKEEIIPLCESEAKITCSYNRLVKELMTAGRHSEAEAWIAEGITVTKDKLPGIATRLREKLLKIRTLEKDWPAVAAMQVNVFVQNPSRKTFSDCKDAALRVGLWEKVSQHLLTYLEHGMLPWRQKKWPLNQSNLDLPSDNRSRQFPMLADLIDIAIMEKKPDKVLHWYNLIPEEQIGWYTVDDDAVAAAIEVYAPEQAVAIWQTKAERLIDQVRPSAYQEAAKYLRKAGVIMVQEKKKDEWKKYLNKLRTKHIRKRRLIEIISGLEGRPIVKNRQ